MKNLRRVLLHFTSRQWFKQLSSTSIRLSMLLFAAIIVNALAFALAGGHMAATQVISGLAQEVSGPFAYAGSLLMIAGSAIA